MNKKFLSLTLAVLLCLSVLAGCAANDKELVMATNAEFPPYEYREGDEIVGIDVEIAQAIAKEMGRTLVIDDMDFDSVLAAAPSGKADIAVAGMTVTEDRLKSMDFSTPYTQATQMIIVAEGSDIKTPDDLTGKKIGVQLGTTGDIYVSDVEGAEVTRYKKGFEAVQDLIKGAIDAVVIDGQPAKVFVSQNDGLVLLDEPFTDEEYAIAVKKGNTEILNAVNDAIAKLKESGELDKIIAKYISED